MALEANSVFLVGAPRSGTTLLQYMLRSHPRLSAPTGESHFVIPLLKGRLCKTSFKSERDIFNVLNLLHKKWAEFLDTDLHGVVFSPDNLASAMYRNGVRDARSLVESLFRMNAEGEAKDIWIDKTPYYVRHICFLADSFPSSKFIHVVRDGRDVALSMMERKWDFGVFNELEAARQWEWYVTEGRRSGMALGSNRYMEIRYEDLISSSEREVRRVCEFLGVEYSDSVINFRKASDPYGKTPLLKGAIQPSNTEKWRKNMTRMQRLVFECQAGDALALFGYSSEFIGENRPSARIFYLRFHQLFLSAFGKLTRR